MTDKFYSRIVGDTADKSLHIGSNVPSGSSIQSRRPTNSLLIDNAAFKAALARLAGRMTSNPSMREELLQEAMVHLWITEVRRPGQTRSWYLQSCRFHLQHYLSAGRSIDSGRRSLQGHSLTGDSETDEGFEWGDLEDERSSVVPLVSERDLIYVLRGRLNLEERAVLDGLADGIGLREIGRRLGLSHTMVRNHRRKIASLTSRLETPNANRRSNKKETGIAKPVGSTQRKRAISKTAAGAADLVSMRRIDFSEDLASAG